MFDSLFKSDISFLIDFTCVSASVNAFKTSNIFAFTFPRLPNFLLIESMLFTICWYLLSNCFEYSSILVLFSL